MNSIKNPKYIRIKLSLVAKDKSYTDKMEKTE